MIVVGTGLAGLTAAVRLAEGGARVLVLAKGVGATHLSAGTIDVLGYAPERVERPVEALPGYLAERPGHPYAVVGVEGIEAAMALAEGARPGLHGLARAQPAAADRGRRAAAVAPWCRRRWCTATCGPRARSCAVGFRGMKDFHPALLADGLRRSDVGVDARSIELDLVPEGRADVNSLGYARAFDDAAFRDRVVSALAGQLRRRRAGRVSRRARDRLAARGLGGARGAARPAGVRGADAAALGAGDAAARGVARRAARGARDGPAQQRRGRLRGFRGARRVAARAGRAARGASTARTGSCSPRAGSPSGGLELDSHWEARETALGLPVAGVPARGEQRFEPEYFARHAMNRAGVAVDGSLRPVDAEGAPVYENVLVAGATLGGGEPWREKSGDGISLSTGYAAAGHVLAAAKTIAEAKR